MRLCSVPGCNGKVDARGWCKTHYSRWRLSGSTRPDEPVRRRRECAVEGCTNLSSSRGWCIKHYVRWKRHGDPLVFKKFKNVDIEIRFWAKVDRRGPDECWLWQASLAAGYGQFFRDLSQRSAPAHRVAYELLVGPIPDGLHLDHLCRVTQCVNPAHLEPVTSAENTRRGGPATKTECVNGHPLDEVNTYRDPATGRRACRICRKAADARRAPRKRTRRDGRPADAWSCHIGHRNDLFGASLRSGGPSARTGDEGDA